MRVSVAASSLPPPSPGVATPLLGLNDGGTPMGSSRALGHRGGVGALGLPPPSPYAPPLSIGGGGSTGSLTSTLPPPPLPAAMIRPSASGGSTTTFLMGGTPGTASPAGTGSVASSVAGDMTPIAVAAAGAHGDDAFPAPPSRTALAAPRNGIQPF
jgi:hypothetical protein